MPKTISKALEQRLLRSAQFVEHLKDLQYMTGLEVLYISSLGEERIRFPREPITPLRVLDHAVPSLLRTRVENRQAALVGADVDHPLPWIEVIHPIQVEQEPVGYLVISAWRPENGFIDPLRALWLSWASKGYDLRWQDLETQWKALPSGSESQLQAWKRHLRLVADDSIRQLEHPNEPHLIPDHLPAIIRNACELVQKTFRDPVTLESVARHCGISSEHLSRTFHQTTGLRFREYVAETRIQEVCKELQETSDSIGEIAQRNGFATLSRFNRAFKNTMGMTPREWRKRWYRMQKSI
jgi:AraC-like DNA-binding protein